MMDAFAYLFRFCCDPLYNADREIPELVRFAERSRSDDVMVFCNVEEMNTGHTTPEEREVYLDLLRRVRGALPESVSVSVNQWHSLMHMDQGKTLHPGQDFRLMKDIRGKESTLCVCPACVNWLDYISELYAAYAAVKPFALWVEDDFRFHNHAPLEWGGCFCDFHMERFSRAAGRTLTREEFLEGVLRPGEPHPYRKIWLDSCREDLINAASRIREAVNKASPNSRVGLMSSVPQVHAAEGRDWKALLRTLAGDTPPVNRPHLPAYGEITPAQYMLRFNQIPLLNRAFLPEETEVYPELENFPYSLHTKSKRFTRFQLLSALPMNLRGMTIDLFDLNGNGINREEGWEELLWDTKDTLIALQDTGVFREKKLGVRVLVSPDSGYTLHTRRGESMEELYPHETLFPALFGVYGIAFSYETDPALRGQAVAVGGQVLRSFTGEQIEALFRENFVLLDGEAAEALHELGYGRLAGIKGCRWIPQDDGTVSYEQVEDGVAYCGIPGARASAMVSCCDLLDVEYDGPTARIVSGFYDSFRRRRANAQSLIGGRVYVFPFGRLPSPTEIPPMLINAVRGAMLRAYIAGAVPSPMTACPHLNLYAYERPRGYAVYAVNAATDETGELVLLTDGSEVTRVRLLSSEGNNASLRDVSFTQKKKELWIKCSLPPFETALLEIETGGNVGEESEDMR